MSLLQATAIQMPLKDKSVQLCCFSPPYWGLRKYSVLPMVWDGDEGCEHKWGNETFSRANDSNRGTMEWTTGGDPGIKVLGKRSPQGQFCRLCNAWRGDLGLEPIPGLYLDHMMQVVAECWRVLRDDGVCFVNIGDTYSTHTAKRSGQFGKGIKKGFDDIYRQARTIPYREKSLCLIPQKFAIRCQEAGWIIRSEIIWAKPNPMPESCKDRPTRSHEQVWMMTKRGKYSWDQDAVREPQTGNAHSRGSEKGNEAYQKARGSFFGWKTPSVEVPGGRNIRDVWTIATEPTPEAHFATFPSKLVEPMIRAATKPGDIVLDPFCGTAKTVIEAEKLNRIGIGLDLSWEYLSEIAVPRLKRPLQKELAAL